MKFNPLTDTLTNEAGEEVKLNPPVGVELPPNGFAVEDAGFIAAMADGSAIEPLPDDYSVARNGGVEGYLRWLDQD